MSFMIGTTNTATRVRTRQYDSPLLLRLLRVRKIGVMEKITSFLGLPPLAEDILQSEWNIARFQSPIYDMNQKSFERLSHDDLFQIKKVAGNVLGKYGYERPHIGMSA